MVHRKDGNTCIIKVQVTKKTNKPNSSMADGNEPREGKPNMSVYFRHAKASQTCLFSLGTHEPSNIGATRKTISMLTTPTPLLPDSPLRRVQQGTRARGSVAGTVRSDPFRFLKAIGCFIHLSVVYRRYKDGSVLWALNSLLSLRESNVLCRILVYCTSEICAVIIACA